MKTFVGVVLVFVAIGFALDWFGVHGAIPRTLFLGVMLSSLGYVAYRQHGLRTRPTR